MTAGQRTREELGREYEHSLSVARDLRVPNQERLACYDAAAKLRAELAALDAPAPAEPQADRERLAKLLKPDLWSDDEMVRHHAASAMKLEFARDKSRREADALITAGVTFAQPAPDASDCARGVGGEKAVAWRYKYSELGAWHLIERKEDNRGVICEPLFAAPLPRHVYVIRSVAEVAHRKRGYTHELFEPNPIAPDGLKSLGCYRSEKTACEAVWLHPPVRALIPAEQTQPARGQADEAVREAAAQHIAVCLAAGSSSDRIAERLAAAGLLIGGGAHD